MKRAIIRWSKVPDGSFKVLQRRQSKELHKHSDIETAFNDIEFHICAVECWSFIYSTTVLIDMQRGFVL